MHTENTSKPAELGFLFLGLGLLFFLHFFALYEVPGLHFDEAWALNHAYRLAQGSFTFEGMSPYTAPWAHYWAALWMSAFGPSLFVFRLSQVLLSLLGVGFLALALARRGWLGGAYLLPLSVALLPGLVMNHRFAIELNGFHAFALGLGAYGLSRGWAWLAALAWVAGTTSHILFYGVGLAVLGACFWEGREFRRHERAAAYFALGLLGLFFLRVLGSIPEKAKALALVGSVGFLFLLLVLKAERWSVWRRHSLEGVVWLLALVFLCNAFLFVEGFWGLSITTGKEGYRGWRLVNLLLFLPVLLWLTQRGSMGASRWLRRAFMLCVICLGFMMLKPAPRYFEIAFLGISVFLALGLARLPFLGRMATVLFLLLHATVLFTEYFSVTPRETALRFLFFKDSSRDFLSKQELVSVLGGSGCDLSAIQSVDLRVRESLVALSRANWPVAPGMPCRWPGLHVERRAESVRGGQREERADFVIWGSP